MQATSSLIEGKVPKKLKKSLQKSVISEEVQQNLAVLDKRLVKQITEKLGINCISLEARSYAEA